MKAKVSVIIPIYNAELYLEQCLDSLLNQTLKDIQIICVNDGSTDRTGMLLEEYKNEDSRIEVLHQSNQYAGVARNNGMLTATGEYLIFLDSDDYFEPDFLEKMYAKSEQNLTDICICDAKVYNESTASIIKKKYLSIDFLPHKDVFSYRDIPNYIYQVTTPAPWNMLFKKDFITRNRLTFENSRFGNDVLFFGKALVLAEKISYVDEKLLTYRTGAMDNLQSKKDAEPTAILKSLSQIKSFLLEKNLYDIVKQSWLQFAVNNILYNLDTLKTYDGFEALYNACFASEHTVENFLTIDECELYNSRSYERLDAYRKTSLEQFRNERFSHVDIYKYSIEGTSLPNRKVSVIIPVYNTIKFVGECIESILKQTLTDIEIIVVNDGSTDGSELLIKEYAKTDNRIICVNKENGGLSIARNTGLELSKGEYIAFVDSDDYLTENALEILYNKASIGNLDILLFDSERHYESEALQEQYPTLDKIKHTLSCSLTLPGSAMFMRLIQTNEFRESVCLKLFRNDFLKSNNITFYEGIVHEDNLFSFVAMVMAEKVSHIRESFYVRRVRSGSIMRTTASSVNFIGYFIIYTEILKLMPSLKLTGAERACATKYLQNRFLPANRIYDNLSKEERKKIVFESNEVAQILYNNYKRFKKVPAASAGSIRKLWRKIVPKSIRKKFV
ncbi:MAG: glycosyltransferase [Lentihominibacter sp.]|jgi:glycosyltransferase involved in cell wall biosynthesis